VWSDNLQLCFVGFVVCIGGAKFCIPVVLVIRLAATFCLFGSHSPRISVQAYFVGLKQQQCSKMEQIRAQYEGGPLISFALRKDWHLHYVAFAVITLRLTQAYNCDAAARRLTLPYMR
jgi:hypothetical protein